MINITQILEVTSRALEQALTTDPTITPKNVSLIKPRATATPYVSPLRSLKIRHAEQNSLINRQR